MNVAITGYAQEQIGKHTVTQNEVCIEPGMVQPRERWEQHGGIH